MNRITAGESSVSHRQHHAHSRAEVLQAKLFRADVGDIAHSMFMPIHYEQNYAYPLVVWLHGSGDDERQLQRVMPHLSLRNYVSVAPRGMRVPNQVATSLDELGADNATDLDWVQSATCLEHAERSVEEAIRVAGDRTHINPERVFLVGFGSGATMALRLGLNNPRAYRGVVAMGGGLPSSNRLFGLFDECRRLPLLICHGRNSVDYPEDQVCDDLRALHIAGLAVTVRQYPCGDDLVDLMLRDANEWLMEQVTGMSNS